MVLKNPHYFRCTHDGTLKEMLVFFRPRHPKKMFYQRLTLPIHELENKRQLKCTFMTIDQKEEKEVTLYPNKGSRVEQMLEEAKQVKLFLRFDFYIAIN